MKNYRIILLAVACVLLASCYQGEDKYAAGKDITISGIESVYNVTALQDVLHIEPQIITTDPNDELEYIWRIWVDYSEVQTVPSGLVVDTLSYEQVLDHLVVERPQRYRLEFKVTDITTGQEAYAITTVNVTNEFSTGFYILKDVGGMSDMDLHTPDGTLMPNVAEQIRGASFPGTPNTLSVLPRYTYIDPETLENPIISTLNIATTDGFWIIDTGDLTVCQDLETMFYFPPGEEMPLFSTFVYYGAIYISDAAIYYTTYDVIWGGGGSGIFGTALGITGGYRPNINVTADRYFTYVFDELNGRFLTINYNGDFYACSDQVSGGGTPEVSPNNIENTMLYFGRNKIGSNQATGFVVMQHPSDQSVRYLYEMTLSGTTWNPMLWRREITGLNINRATLFAANEIQSRMLYYVADNTVYTYLVDDGTEEPTELTDFGIGEEITYIKNLYWTAASSDDGNFNYLAIGTQSGGNYKMYLYSMVAGVPIDSPQILEGEGKAVKMQYLTPDFTENIGNYQYPIGN